MKIVQVVTQMEAGGAQKTAWLLTEGLRQRGHDCQLWFLYKKRPAFKENGFIHCFSPHRPAKVQWLGVAVRLWQKLHELQPDVILTHTHSANMFAAPIAAMATVPVRVVVHHNPYETYTPIARAADAVAFRTGCYSSMVTVSGGVSHSFARHSERYRCRLHRIYNGIAEPDIDSSIEVRKRYQIPERHTLFVNVGRLAKQKNQAMLFAMLQQIPDATLLLVGEGEMREALHAAAVEDAVAERVRFTGELPGPEVAAILREADLFLLPSHYESFCLAAVEAMHHGVPVVAHDLPCLREVLGDEQIFFPSGDTQELVRIVKRLLTSSEQRARMSAAGRARADRFTVDRMVAEYECLMAEELIYTSGRKSATYDFGRVNALGRVPRVHDHL